MGRYSIDFTYMSRYYDTSQAEFRTYLTDIRDRFRHWLSGSSFIVSDIGRWDGRTGGYEGNAFIVKKGDDEWFFMFPRNNTTGMSWREYWSYSTTTSILSKYWRSETGSELAGGSSVGHAFSYNLGSGSWVPGFGFDDTVNLTWTSGDFQTTAINPNTVAGADDFMPHENVRGIGFNFETWDVHPVHFFRHLITFDDDLGMTGKAVGSFFTQNDFLSSNGSGHGVRVSGIFGDCLLPDGVGDTHSRVMGWTHNGTSGTDNFAYGGIIEDSVWCLDSSGALQLHSFDRTTPFNGIPSPGENTGGVFPWSSVGVSSVASGWKGKIHDGAARIFGAQNSPDDLFRIIDTPHGPIEKVNGTMGFMIAPGIPPFPFAKRFI